MHRSAASGNKPSMFSLQANYCCHGAAIPLGLFFAVLVVTAWLADDALITLRSVLNFHLGYGPNFNIAERVQSYTHPLWFLLLSLVHVFSGNIFNTAIVVSIMCCMIAVGILYLGIAQNHVGGVVFLAMLICGRCFIDYSTSGLENPLAYLLLAVLVLYHRHSATSPIIWVVTWLWQAGFGASGFNSNPVAAGVTCALVYQVTKAGRVTTQN